MIEIGIVYKSKNFVSIPDSYSFRRTPMQYLRFEFHKNIMICLFLKYSKYIVCLELK